MKDLEALKNLIVNIDSETARQIAESYMRFKYFELILTFVVLVSICVVIGYAIKKAL